MLDSNVFRTHAMRTIFRRVPLRYSLRAMLIAVALLCVWLARHVDHVRRQAEAVNALRASGAKGLYFSQMRNLRSLKPGAAPWGPKWLRGKLGDDFFNEVATVSFRGAPFKDDDLRHLRALTSLRELYLGGGNDDIADISDAGLAHVSDLQTLQIITIEGNSKVTSAGLRNLRRLTRLKQLFLEHPTMSDAWIEHLKPFKQLEEIGAWARYGTPISDKSLEVLSELPELRMVYFQGSQITDQGIQRLNEKLPNCKVYR